MIRPRRLLAWYLTLPFKQYCTSWQILDNVAKVQYVLPLFHLLQAALLKTSLYSIYSSSGHICVESLTTSITLTIILYDLFQWRLQI